MTNGKAKPGKKKTRKVRVAAQAGLSHSVLCKERDVVAAVLETAPALVLVVDEKGRIAEFNRACQELSGYSLEEVQGRRPWDFLPPAKESRAVRAIFVELLSGRSVGGHEYSWVTRSGDRLRIAWSFALLRDDEGTVKYVLHFGVDITRQRAAENALRASEAELRRSQERMQTLARGLLDLQERERRRLARDLHDDLSQKAAALALDASALANNTEGSQPGLFGKIDHLAKRASGLCMELARLAHELHPVGIEKLGLVSALKSLTVEHSIRYGIEMHFTYRKIPPALPAGISLCLFRIAQEAVRNIARHSQASRAYVTVAGDGDGIRLSIRDQGRGFDPNSDDGPAGLGLIGIKERVRLAGGTFSLDAKPGAGVRIEVRVPLLQSEVGGFTETDQQ